MANRLGNISQSPSQAQVLHTKQIVPHLSEKVVISFETFRKDLIFNHMQGTHTLTHIISYKCAYKPTLWEKLKFSNIFKFDKTFLEIVKYAIITSFCLILCINSSTTIFLQRKFSLLMAGIIFLVEFALILCFSWIAASISILVLIKGKTLGKAFFSEVILNRTKKNGASFRDPITLEPIFDINSSLVTNCSGQFWDIRNLVKSLLSIGLSIVPDPEVSLPDPIYRTITVNGHDTQKFLDPQDNEIVLTHICDFFAITKQNFLDCWNVNITQEEKNQILQELLKRDGILSNEIQQYLNDPESLLANEMNQLKQWSFACDFFALLMHFHIHNVQATSFEAWKSTTFPIFFSELRKKFHTIEDRCIILQFFFRLELHKKISEKITQKRVEKFLQLIPEALRNNPFFAPLKQ